MGTLFRHEDGRSIVFAMQPCEEKAEIRPLIENHGGVLAARGEIDIRLIGKGKKAHTNGMVKTQYIWDCVEKGILLDHRDYLAKHVDVSDVSDIEDDGTTNKITVDLKSMKGRKVYHQDDDETIIKYLVDKNETSSYKGNAVWKTMEFHKITSHSWQSMKNRFKKTILQNINSYNLPQKYKTKILKLLPGYRDLSSEEEEPRDNDSDGSLSTEYGSPETKLNRSIGRRKQDESEEDSPYVLKPNKASKTSGQGFGPEIVDFSDLESAEIPVARTSSSAELVSSTTPAKKSLGNESKKKKKSVSPKEKKTVSQETATEDSPTSSQYVTPNASPDMPTSSSPQAHQSPVKNKRKFTFRPTFSAPKKELSSPVSTLTSGTYVTASPETEIVKKSLAQSTTPDLTAACSDYGTLTPAAPAGHSSKTAKMRALLASQSQMMDTQDACDTPDALACETQDHPETLDVGETQDGETQDVGRAAAIDEEDAEMEEIIDLMKEVSVWLGLTHEELLHALYVSNGSLSDAVNWILTGLPEPWTSKADGIILDGVMLDGKEFEEIKQNVGSAKLEERLSFLSAYLCNINMNDQ